MWEWIHECVALCAAVSNAKKGECMLSSAESALKLIEKLSSKTIETAHDVLILLYMAALTIQSPVQSTWMKPRSNSWWEDVINATFTSNDWFENFKATLLYVCNELRSSVEEWHHNKKSYTSGTAICWLLSTGADFCTVGHFFGVSKSTVCVIMKQVCSALVAILLPKYIRFRNSDRLKEVVDGFKRKFGFPQCAGVVDGTHTPIVSPVEYPTDYYNHKGFHSIIMQGAVNHLGQFIDI